MFMRMSCIPHTTYTANRCNINTTNLEYFTKLHHERKRRLQNRELTINMKRQFAIMAKLFV